MLIIILVMLDHYLKKFLGCNKTQFHVWDNGVDDAFNLTKELAASF